MNPRSYLKIVGVILIVVAILGFVGVIGPTPDKSIFGPGWWFDNVENWAHLVIGIVAIGASFVLPMTVQKPFVMVVGVVVTLVGLYSIFSHSFLGANLENPADTLLHIVIGVWAIAASMGKKKMA